MRISLFAACIAASAVLMTVAAVAQPRPQLNRDDLLNTFNQPATPGGAPANTPNTSADGCEPGFARGESGDCEQVKDGTLGFNLGAAGKPPPPNTTITTQKAPPVQTVQPPPPPRAANLLLTFQTNSTQLTDQGLANAQVFADVLKDPRLISARFEIEGHTDASGSREYNMALSQRRADAVKQFLVSQGISPARLTTIGYGFARLANQANPLSGENRRVVARRIQ